MFGYPALFSNGNMAAGLHGSGLVLRLPDAEREALLRLPGARPFEPMPGRVMREYAVAPPAFAKKPSEVSAWLRKAFAYASSLEPKRSARKKSQSRRAD
jgi:TfoX/Sxy family transcriptional regulator of competence genes